MRKWLPYILVPGALLLAISVPTTRYWLQNNAGRWHILILHFPLALIMLASVMELALRFQWKGVSRETIRFVLGLGMMGAIFSAITGLVLHEQGTYAAELLEVHEVLGLVTAGLSVVTFWLQATAWRKVYYGAFGLTLAALTLTGHYGGSLTHGESFLTEQLTNISPPGRAGGPQVAYEAAEIWADLIAPILEAKCRSCHNPGKLNGGLSLTDSLSMVKGGDHGNVLRGGLEANLCSYLHLPLEDKLHMPPEGKAQLTDAERDFICWWLENGTPYSGKLADMAHSPEQEALFRKHFTLVHPSDLLGIEPVPPTEIARLNAAGIRVMQADPARPWLHVNLSDRPQLEAADWEPLEDIADNITHLDLGNSPISEALMDRVGDFANLRVLKLDQCTLPNGALRAIRDLAYLEELNLYRAQLPDNSAEVLSQLTGLRKLYLWESNLTTEKIAELRTALPETEIIAADPAADFPMQQMVAPYFTQESPFCELGTPLPLACRYPGVEIRYTLDGSEPGETSSLLQDNSTFTGTGRIRARAYLEGWKPSEITDQTLIARPTLPFTVTSFSRPDDKYAGVGGEAGLHDESTGEALITDKHWVGYWGKDCDLRLDLGEEKDLAGVAVHVLEDVKSWVLFPRQIQVSFGRRKNRMDSSKVREFDRTLQAQGGRSDVFLVPVQARARYLRLRIRHYGKLPEWHDSPGQPAWLFLDEVAVY